MVQSNRCLPYKQKFPKLIQSEFIAPNCSIIGDVKTGKLSSLFFGVTIKADNCTVNIGNRTIIQDNTQILNSGNEYSIINIGDNVSIGVNCYIDNSIIKDDSIVGDGATIHKGCVLESGSMVAAGAVLQPNTIVPKNQIYAGNPAKYLRDIKLDEHENISENKSELLELANVLVEETEKTQQEIISDMHFRVDRANLDWESSVNLAKNMMSYHVTKTKDEFMLEAGNEGFDDIEGESIRTTLYNVFNDEGMHMKFQHDLKNYPDYLKIYNENFDRYENINKDAENLNSGEARDISLNKPNNPIRPGAMRAWINKWDPDFNTTFKGVGSKTESNNQ